jgi:hypothetical protein
MGRGHRRRKEVKELRHQVDATPTVTTEHTDRDVAADDTVAPPDPSTDRLADP